jgi:trigger factor
LDENFERISRNKLEDEILAKLLEATSFDPPPSMVDMQAQQLLEEMKTNLAYQGISWEFYLQRTEQDEEALKENFKPRALHQVKNYFLLKEIALKEGIEVSDEELDARIEELAEQFQMTKEQLREYYEKSGQLGSLRSEIETEKTLQFLVDNAIIEEQVIDPKELS